MKIGVLAVQGAFLEHEKILKKLNTDFFEIRQKKDIEKHFDALIIPGGESTSIAKLLYELDIFNSIQEKIKNGLPVFGTCAGMILLAKSITNYDHSYFATMDIAVKRNAYGRQLGSFETYSNFGNIKNVPMVFIRAPYIENVGENVKVLSVVNQNIVAAQQDNQLVTAFHPELLDYTEIHNYFIEKIVKNNI